MAIDPEAVFHSSDETTLGQLVSIPYLVHNFRYAAAIPQAEAFHAAGQAPFL